jgi:NADH/F420H2 dehydrogenase subunit C
MDVTTKIPTNGGGFLDKHGDTWKQQLETLKSKFQSALEEVRTPWDYPTDVPILFVKKDALIGVLDFLKTDPAFNYGFLADYTATDEETEPRFELVFNLYNWDQGPRIRVKCRLKEGEDAPTAVGLWKGADWAEREIFDMFGIRFEGHPNLRRILMDYRWVGYPLRKDYPLDGFQLFPDAEAPDVERLK